MPEKIKPRTKAPKMPRRFWTMKPVTKIKQSKKGEAARKFCREKKGKEKSE